ncbi:LysR substrate-binding domain-containing protein [Rhodoplanes sp. SY1]|uniref:LysR substrate-binding domain-containing protein n=1 Tax=Rhodoplanes sp. SY1 TaxID=3166646 RepID=UPI0038B69557
MALQQGRRPAQDSAHAPKSSDQRHAGCSRGDAGGGRTLGAADLLTGDYLASGRLVQVLPDWSLPAGGVYAVYPTARFGPPKVTTFVSMLVEANRRPS